MNGYNYWSFITLLQGSFLSINLVNVLINDLVEDILKQGIIHYFG